MQEAFDAEELAVSGMPPLKDSGEPTTTMIAGVFVANVAAEVGVEVPPKDDGRALSAPTPHRAGRKRDCD